MPQKTVDDRFAEYAMFHQNPTNKIVHWVCIPLIVLGILGLPWELPTPSPRPGIPSVNWAILTVVACLTFYARLSLSLTGGMLVMTKAALFLNKMYDQSQFASVWQTSLAIFVLAWPDSSSGKKSKDESQPSSMISSSC